MDGIEYTARKLVYHKAIWGRTWIISLVLMMKLCGRLVIYKYTNLYDDEDSWEDDVHYAGGLSYILVV